MQGLCVRVLPAAWNHARALVPSQSRHRGPSILRWPQLGAGSGKGQNPALVPVDHRAVCVGARRTANQAKRAGGGWHLMRPFAGFRPKSLRF